MVCRFPTPIRTTKRIVDAAGNGNSWPCGDRELVVRGPQGDAGLLEQQVATGDPVLAPTAGCLRANLASCDENGFFRIVDRKKT